MLAHEVAHCFLHGKTEQGRSSKTVRETEAEAVAYAVCQSIGLDASLASSDYVAQGVMLCSARGSLHGIARPGGERNITGS